LLFPEAIFGANAFSRVQIFLETSQIAYSIVSGRKVYPEPGGGIPGSKADARFGAHVGLVAGGQTTLGIDQLPDNGVPITLEP
jgi:hypothetical protein